MLLLKSRSQFLRPIGFECPPANQMKSLVVFLRSPRLPSCKEPGQVSRKRSASHPKRFHTSAYTSLYPIPHCLSLEFPMSRHLINTVSQQSQRRKQVSTFRWSMLHYLHAIFLVFVPRHNLSLVTAEISERSQSKKEYWSLDPTMVTHQSHQAVKEHHPARGAELVSLLKPAFCENSWNSFTFFNQPGCSRGSSIHFSPLWFPKSLSRKTKHKAWKCVDNDGNVGFIAAVVGGVFIAESARCLG